MTQESDPGSTRRLAHFVASTGFADLPTGVVEQAKKLTLDAVGCAILGSRARTAATYSKVVSAFGQSGESTVVGNPWRGSAFAAALLNAAFMHQTELGVAVARAVVHPSAAVVPAALSVCEREHGTGKDLLRSVALGCEALIRFGYTMASDPAAPEGDNPPSLLQGWIPPILLSPLGSSTAASVLLGVTEDALHHAWGLAANLCPATVIKIQKDGVTGRALFMGVGSANGILAADLAAKGVAGLADITGDWMPVIVPAFDTTWITRGLGTNYEMTDVLFKQYGIVGTIFPPLEAMFALLEEHSFRPDDIEEITVEGYRRTVWMERPVPASTPEGAKSHLGYALATAIVFRDRGLLLHELSAEVLVNETVVGLAKKIHAVLNADYQLLYPIKGDKSLVRVRLKDGRCLEKEVDLRLIGRYYAPTRNDVEAKFERVCAGILDPARVHEIAKLVWNIDSVDDVGELGKLIAD